VLQLILENTAECERRLGGPFGGRGTDRFLDVLNADDAVLVIAEQILHRRHAADQATRWFTVERLEKLRGIAESFGGNAYFVEGDRFRVSPQIFGTFLQPTERFAKSWRRVRVYRLTRFRCQVIDALKPRCQVLKALGSHSLDQRVERGVSLVIEPTKVRAQPVG
jgi:hypothetical protein